MAGRRRERIAHNEARFRSINETASQRFRRGGGEVAGFVCECGDLDCAALVHVPVGMYEQVRADSRRFLIRPGHELPDVEDVVERGPRFAVVQKHDDLAEIAERTDPRRAT